MGCGCGSKKGKKTNYRCEICGNVSDKPKDCCGQPMKEQK